MVYSSPWQRDNDLTVEERRSARRPDFHPVNVLFKFSSPYILELVREEHEEGENSEAVIPTLSFRHYGLTLSLQTFHF